MAISRKESIGRFLIIVPVAIAGVWGMMAGIPYASVTTEQQWWIGVFRAMYGLLVAFRLMRTLPGAALLHGWRRTKEMRHIYIAWSFVAMMICVGFLTPLVLTVHWLLGCTIQRWNRVYSVEDVLFRATGFCLLFLQSQLAFSLDAEFGWTFGLGGSSVLGVNFFMWTLALLMFSAGLEKMWSPLWHKGLGFYYFMSLPHLVKPYFSWLNRSRWLSVVLSWITVFSELLLIPAMFFPWLRWTLYFLLGGFAVTLFILVDISFIGQLTLLLIVGAVALDWNRQQLAPETLPVFQSWSMPEWVLFFFLATIFVLGAWSSSGLARLRSGLVSRIMGLTTHFRPFTVFVEIHFYGLYLFRLLARMNDGSTKKILDVFKDTGAPGKLQTWRPRTFSGSMYRFTDYCIAVLENLEQRRIERAEFVMDIAYAGWEQLSESERRRLDHIELEVRVFDPADNYEPDTKHWLSADWKPILRVSGFPDKLSLEQTSTPPRYKKTYRWPVTFE